MAKTVVFDFDGVIHEYFSGWIGSWLKNLPQSCTLTIGQFASMEMPIRCWRRLKKFKPWNVKRRDG